MGKASITCRLLAAACFLTYLPCTLTQTTSPRLLLILLDGFRHDYLNKTSAPHPGFDKLTRQGVRAKRLVPDFPSLSVPNWYSLMTGLHTEAHGMTGNHMHDVSREDNFLLYQYPHPDISSLWWQGGEPLWVTAARQNKSTSMFYWPGCEVEIQGYRPSFCQNYTGVPSLEEFRSALKTSLSKLEKGETDIAAIYHERTDYIGHVSGPDSAQMQEAVLELDPIMSDLVDRLSDPAMSEVNLMVFSDHGMTELSESRVIDISTVLDPADYSIVLEGAALASVYTTPEREAQVFEKLKDFHPNLTLYRKADLPERWHFKHGPHVAPVTAVADLGWFIKTPTEKGMSIPTYQGMHGYDNVHSDMHGFFIGFGPAFKQGEAVERLRNVDLYHVMCHALHLSPSPNNGSLYDVIPLLASDDAGDNTVTLLITFFSVVAVFVISARKKPGEF